MGALTTEQPIGELMAAVRYEVTKARLERLGFDVSEYRRMPELGIEES